MIEKIKIGISTCLLGENVRYDGTHKLDRFLTETLGKYLEYIPVCPEVECGLTTPRESMHLSGNSDNPRLITTRTGKDYTGQMQKWGKKRLKELEQENLCGYIFKSKSPSSGMERIKIYNKKNIISTKGIGIWARMFKDYFPLLPIEDEGRLHDPKLRENFIERVFIYKRWREIDKNRKALGSLVAFHKRHKLLFMSRSPQFLKELGKLVAKGKEHAISDLFSKYLSIMTEILTFKSTVRKNVNVLHHIMGYFKKNLTTDEKQELLTIIDDYHKGYVPLIVPVTLLNHYVKKYNEPYLKKQYYLNPHPVELKLRNHA